MGPHTGRYRQTLPVNAWGPCPHPAPHAGPQTRWPHRPGHSPARTQSGLGSRTFWSQGTGVRLSFKQRWNAGGFHPFHSHSHLDAGVSRAWQPPDLRDPGALNREARVCKSCFFPPLQTLIQTNAFCSRAEKKVLNPPDTSAARHGAPHWEGGSSHPVLAPHPGAGGVERPRPGNPRLSEQRDQL